MGKSTISMAIYNSYVKFPEGILKSYAFPPCIPDCSNPYAAGQHVPWLLQAHPDSLEASVRGLNWGANTNHRPSLLTKITAVYVVNRKNIWQHSICSANSLGLWKTNGSMRPRHQGWCWPGKSQNVTISHSLYFPQVRLVTKLSPTISQHDMLLYLKNVTTLW